MLQIFEPFAHEQREAIYTLCATGAFVELLQQDVPLLYKAEGRGLFMCWFTGTTLNTIQPPIYVGVEQWRHMLLLEDADLNTTMASYNPDREFVLLVAGIKGTYCGLYAWWRVPLGQLPSTKLWER